MQSISGPIPAKRAYTAYPARRPVHRHPSFPTGGRLDRNLQRGPTPPRSLVRLAVASPAQSSNPGEAGNTLGEA